MYCNSMMKLRNGGYTQVVDDDSYDLLSDPRKE